MTDGEIRRRQLLGMRRTRDGYEKAYNEFVSARNNYMRILDDWDASDAERTRSWTAELQHSFKTLEKKLNELSAKSVHSVAKLLGPKVFGVDAHGQSELIFANKQQADKFSNDVNKYITLSLSKFQGRLVHIVQELATRAHSQRLEALKVGIEETQGGVGESLADNVTPRFPWAIPAVTLLFFLSWLSSGPWTSLRWGSRLSVQLVF